MAKSPHAFRTISEAAEEVGVPQHVLRFWETKFAFVTPMKRAGGRRFYRPEDVRLLRAIRRLLHEEGLTIRGVQRLHKDQGLARLSAYGDPDEPFAMTLDPAGGALLTGPAGAPSPKDRSERLGEVLAQLEAAKARLDAVLAG